MCILGVVFSKGYYNDNDCYSYVAFFLKFQALKEKSMLNMNFAKKVFINTQEQPWIASSHSGIWRKPLAREEVERGHATSLVKFDAGASFKEHAPLRRRYFSFI